jgi:hypothetical protein
MFSDSRYPHLIPLDGRPVNGLDVFERNHAVRVGRAIGARTQTRPFFNLNTGAIFFSRRDCPQHGGVYEMSFKPVGEQSRVVQDHEIDEMVNYMNLSLVPESVKDEWTAGHAKREENEKEKWMESKAEGGAHEAENYAAFLSRKRRGVGTLVKAL